MYLSAWLLILSLNSTDRMIMHSDESLNFLLCADAGNQMLLSEMDDYFQPRNETTVAIF